jgi:aminoglycoside 3-N-acetyltransferase
MTTNERPYITLSRLQHDLAQLGIAPGDVVMLHVSVKAIGWIVGGPDVVLRALLDVLTPSGTLMMYASWEDNPDDLATGPPDRQQAYLAECPPFDPATSRAERGYSILTEYLRTWPGAQRSANPSASMAAVGAQARWLTADHPLQYGYGPGSPLAKLYQLGGKVLMLGAPLNTITLLHYAENLAHVPDKRITRYRLPLLQDGQRTWVDIEEFDTSDGIVDWPGQDYFEIIAEEFLAAGGGRTALVGAAQAYLFDAQPLVDVGVAWMERHFAQQPD